MSCAYYNHILNGCCNFYSIYADYRNCCSQVFLQGMISHLKVFWGTYASTFGASSFSYGMLLIAVGSKSRSCGIDFPKYFGINIFFTVTAACLAEAVVSFPTMYRNVKPAFLIIDITIENEARTLGASEISVFFKITVPMAMPRSTMRTSIVLFKSSEGIWCYTYDCRKHTGKNPDNSSWHNERVLFSRSTNLDIAVKNRNIGYVFKDYALFLHLNVLDNVCFGLKCRKNYDKDHIEQLLNSFRIKLK